MLGMKKKYNYRFACNAKINSCYDKMVFGGKTRHKVIYPKGYKNSNESGGSLFFGKLGVKTVLKISAILLLLRMVAG